MLREMAPKAIRRPLALADAAFDQLRADLVSAGPLTARRRLVAGDLAIRLGMSRTPVREALDRLSRLGYLEVLEGGGYRRRRYRTRDIRDVYELRLLLEPVAAELAASNGKDALAATDGSFHGQVARASGNRVLSHVVDLLAERVAAMRTDLDRSERQHAPGGAKRDRRLPHATIAAAIARGDGPEARQAMADHLAAEARGLLRRLPSEDPGAISAPDS